MCHGYTATNTTAKECIISHSSASTPLSLSLQLHSWTSYNIIQPAALNNSWRCSRLQILIWNPTKNAANLSSQPRLIIKVDDTYSSTHPALVSAFFFFCRPHSKSIAWRSKAKRRENILPGPPPFSSRSGRGLLQSSRGRWQRRIFGAQCISVFT